MERRHQDGREDRDARDVKVAEDEDVGIVCVARDTQSDGVASEGCCHDGLA